MATVSSRFKRDELKGYFRWSSKLTGELHAGGISHLFHAYHPADVPALLRANEGYLSPRSEVGSRAADGTRKAFKGLWVTPHDWHEPPVGHNRFGPITVRIPLQRIEGRRFYVFRRIPDDSGWVRYYFVEAPHSQNLFADRELSEPIDPREFFTECEHGYRRTMFVNYEFVLTNRITMRGAQIFPTAHRECVSKGCPSMTSDDSEPLVTQCLADDIKRLLLHYPGADLVEATRLARKMKGVKLARPKRS